MRMTLSGKGFLNWARIAGLVGYLTIISLEKYTDGWLKTQVK